MPEVVPAPDRARRAGVVYRQLEHGERRSVYWTLGAGLVLRLVYEVLAALPTVGCVEVVASAPSVAPGMDAEHPGAVIELTVTRSAFAAVDLDRVPPARLLTLLRQLGGRMDRPERADSGPVVESA